ncbi:MAG: serine hydrolase domain-containing protein [Microbacteriaceae bacterium]
MIRPKPLTMTVAAVTAGLTLTWGILMTPPSPNLQPHTSGDTALAQTVEQLARDEGALDRVSVAYVDLGATEVSRIAGFGSDEHTEYEIGSLTKTFTGNLFAIALERGEVTADEPLSAVFPELADTPAGGVSLESLSNHHSGLPSLDPATMPRVMLDTLTNRNPYRGTLDDLIEQAGRQTLSDPRHFAYSNIGMSLLGQALAKRAGVSYPELVQRRIFEPLNMRHSRIVLHNEDLQNPTTGYSATGVPQEAWSIGPFAPAGGIRSTIGDMSLYVEALLDGTAPGAAAMDRLLDGENGAEAYAWLVFDQEEGPTITLHNGQTGGFAGYIVLDRAAGHGAVVLSNTATQLQDLVFTLIQNGITS